MDLQHTLQSFVLFCESELWEAPDAVAWVRILENPSPYGNIRQRLDGLRLQDVVNHFRYGAPLPAPAFHPPRIAMFFVTKYAAAELCIGDFDEYSLQEQEITFVRWLESWTKIVAHHAVGGLLHDALPGYMMMRGLIYVTRQGCSLREARPWSRMLLILAWSRHIRRFMETRNELTFELWETLPTPANSIPRRETTYDAGPSEIHEDLDFGNVTASFTGLSC